jgi:cyclophilin family peptidyl-prolyl cis-trans isomerase
MRTHPRLLRFVLPCVMAACLLAAGNAQQPAAQPPVVDTWRYTVQKPADLWAQPDFDDRGWQEGQGGFGTPETPGARVGTVWATNNIWLRKVFTLAVVPQRPALLVHHDEDAEVFINGRQVATFARWATDYAVVPLDESQRAALAIGRNVMAVHCRQTDGGQFIDVHLVDADHVPKLPPAVRQTKPFVSELMTTWGAAVTPANAWTEYPRPEMVRDDWQNLNGGWDYAITPVERRQPPAAWDGKILVPFALESKLGGVQRLLDATEALWYRRAFDASPVAGQRTLLHFEAVDYRCEVMINGRPVGTHVGGYTPFSFDVTDAIRRGRNEVVVRVEDETEGWQLHGKQVRNARGIWYTQVSGIWQTVWLERVAASYIDDLHIGTDAAAGTITVRPTVGGSRAARLVRMTVRDGTQVVAEASGEGAALSLTVKNPRLWSPSSPHLYDLDIALVGVDGRAIDRVRSYAGIRTVGKARDKDGHWRFTLNGQPIFHWGTLDQGWWPDGLLTPPSDAGMRSDIEFLKAAGFNMIRKHIKVEPRRYYYHCDRIGMLVWQDQVSGGKNPPWTTLDPSPKDADWPDEQHAQFMLELERMIGTLENHPSIVVWVPFNEAWGQHRTMEVGEWVARRDPSRLVNIASGGNFWPVGDIVDAHRYPHPGFPFNAARDDRFVMVMGEFGGHGYPVPGHLWDANRRNWGYGGLPQTEAEYKDRYATSIRMLDELRAQGIAAGVYTQTTDVEGEVNGLMTYDRRVAKIPAPELAALNRRLFSEPPLLQQPDAPELNRRAPERFRVRLDTTRGAIVIGVHRAWAPNGADRFFNLVAGGYYDDSRFFRVIAGKWAQFGINGNPKVSAAWRDRTIPDDPRVETNVRGTVAFAFAVPNGRTTQVFINLQDNSANHDKEPFVPFGRVVEGMDFVDALYSEYAESAGGGIRAGKQAPLFESGSAYLSANFPKLDVIRLATIER